MSEETAGRKPDFILGLDLGQSQDYSALAILERRWVRPIGSEASVRHYSLRHLQRWPLKTSYPDIVAEVGRMVQIAPLSNPLLAVDQTGVGVPVVEMIRDARIKAQLKPILITGGHEITYDGKWHVPKKELVSTIQVLLQTHRIKFGQIPERKVLIQELLNFKVKININAHETFEAWRERDHDDMVLAVALAAWLGEGGRDYSEPWAVSDEPPRVPAHRRIFGP
jgi:hypothetical protein